MISTYGRVTRETKSIYNYESGGAGCMVMEIEERHNTIVSCANKFRTGETTLRKYSFPLQTFSKGSMGMLCKNAVAGDYRNLGDNCYMCCTKLITVDSPYANLYGFAETFIRSATTIIGYRTVTDGELFEDQYEHCMSGHGFSPRDVNQNLFQRTQG